MMFVGRLGVVVGKQHFRVADPDCDHGGKAVLL